MRVISFNMEGIVSAKANGFFRWVQNQDADIICLQDIRAHENDLNSDEFQLDGYFSYGCSNYLPEDCNSTGGVAIYTRVTPKAIITNVSSASENMEGRYIQADFNNISIGSLLVPGTVSCADSCSAKYNFLDNHLLFLKKQSRKRREVITCGTFNIAHKTKDVACYEDYKNTPGVLPAEQEWMDYLLNYMNYVDCYREVEQGLNQFSFWLNDINRRQNIGWRIDYQISTQNIRPHVLSAGIYSREVFSRHAPVIIDYEWDLMGLNGLDELKI